MHGVHRGDRGDLVPAGSAGGVAAGVLTLRYLGGCPGHGKPEVVSVAVFDDRFEVQAPGWGWRIGFGSVEEVGAVETTASQGNVLAVRWRPPAAATAGRRTPSPEPQPPPAVTPFTLRLAGADAARLRYLLAAAVASERLAREQAASRADPMLEPAHRGVRPPDPHAGAWARELRRMRAVAVAAMAVALTALIVVSAVAVIMLAQRVGGGHWRSDRAALLRLQDDVRLAGERNDTAGVSIALQALVDECHRLEGYNGEAANTGKDFTETQQLCAAAGVVLY